MKDKEVMAFAAGEITQSKTDGMWEEMKCCTSVIQSVIDSMNGARLFLKSKRRLLNSFK